MSHRRILRTTVALIAGAAAGAAVAVATASPALAAQCWGETPTIVANRATNIIGTPGHDVVEINAAGVTYTPNGGSDFICIRTSAGSTVWAGGSGHLIQGGAGPDFIYGSEGNDVIFGGGGNDLLKGNGGIDVIQGGAGDDYIRGNAGGSIGVSQDAEKLRGNDGNDCILGGPGYEIITGGPGNDTILLGHEHRYSDTQCAPAENDNSAAAAAFRNNLDSNAGNANGEGGHDRIWGSNGGDGLSGDSGNDIINGFAGPDSIDDVSGIDVLKGGAGDDTIIDWDSVGGDQLYGGAGSGDRLHAHSTDTCFPDNGPATTPCL